MFNVFFQYEKKVIRILDDMMRLNKISLCNKPLESLDFRGL